MTHGPAQHASAIDGLGRRLHAALRWAVVRSALLGCSLLVGCSLLNAPDRDLLTDGGTDGPVPDAPVPPTEAGVEVCDPASPGDEDGDGDADCDDFDCVSAPACCAAAASTEALRYEWDEEEADGWARWTETVPDLGTFPTVASTDIGEFALSEFGAGDRADGIVTDACVPLALGRSVQLAFTPRGGATQNDCNTGRASVAVGFTAVRTIEPGDALPTEFSVEVTACGDVRARVGASTVGTTTSLPVGRRFTMSIALTPGPVLAGETQILATVRVPIGGKLTTIVDGAPVAPLSSLLTTGECADAPGLHLALHGLGDGVSVGSLSSAGLECANPRQFRAAVGEAARSTAADLGAGGWAAGGVGAPAFFVTSEDQTLDASAMHLFFDGTNLPRNLDADGITPLGFAVGHAKLTGSGDPLWTSRATGPRFGANPPACLPPAYPDCPDDDEVSIREPSVYSASGVRLLAYARELVVGGVAQRNRYGIDALRPASALQFENTNDADGALDGPSLTPAEAGNCRSIRDPSLVPAPVDGPNRFWLFFTCVPPVGRPDVRAIRMQAASDGDYVLTPDLDDGVHVLLDGAALGEYAESGVFGPEVLLEQDPENAGEVLYRMWFLARNRRRTETSVGVAQWRPNSAAEAPAFEVFAGNPVLREGNTSLSPCPVGARCGIAGWSVGRTGNNVLRFVLARSVNTQGTVTHHFETLEQTWTTPW